MSVATQDQLTPDLKDHESGGLGQQRRRGLPTVDAVRATGSSWLGWTRERLARSPLTGLGWSVLAASALAWLAGVLLGWLELATIAAIGLLLVLLAVPFTLGRTHVGARLALTSLRVVVGERVAGELLVENLSERRQLPFDLELPVGEGTARFAVPSLPAGGSHGELLIIPTERRGIIPVGPANAVRRDPLALLKRGRGAGEHQEILVHPRTVRVGSLGRGLVRDLEGAESEVLSNSDLAFHALREYEPGDDRRHIHWRSSARTSQLMVRQFADTRRSHLTLVLSAADGDYASDEEYELAVSVTGSIGLRALRDEQQVTAVTAGRTVATSTGQRFLDGLAGVSRRASGDDVAQSRRILEREARAGGLLVLVTGSVLDAGRARAMANHLGAGGAAICVRACPGQGSRYAEVSGIPTLSVGALDDLGRLVRAAS